MGSRQLEKNGMALRRLISGDERRMLTGRRIDASTVTLSGAPTGKVWVRAADDSREQTVAYGSNSFPNTPVRVRLNDSGELYIAGLDWQAAKETLGDAMHRALEPVGLDEFIPRSIPGNGFKPGRVQASTLGGLYVNVAAFHHSGGFWNPAVDGSDDLDLTSFIPGTLDYVCWCLVYLDPATNTLDAATSTPAFGTKDDLDEADIATIALPNGAYPLGAVALAYGQTVIDSSSRFADARQHLDNSGGSSFPAYGASASVTIASGVLDISAATSRNIVVQAESGTADTVTEVVGLADGEAAVFRADAGDTITFQDNSDIVLYNGVDVDVVSTDLLELVGRGAGVVGQPVDQNDGGTSIGTLIYEKWDVDAPPASPHASDDEFDGAVSGSWTDYDHGSVMTYAASSYGKGVRMVHAQATQSLAGLLRAAPVGDFSMVTHVRASSAPANRIVALLLAEGTASSSKIYAWLISGAAAGSDATLQLHYSTAYNTFSSSIFSYQIGGVGLAMGAFLRVRRISTTYYFDFSMDGKSWYRYNTNSLSNLSALNYIGIGGATNDAGAGDLITTFDFFRVSTNIDLDTPVHGQLVGMYAPP